MPFQPGQSGNPDGGYRKKLWREAINRATAKPVDGKVDLTKLDQLAAALIMAAEAGDIAALKEIGDRIDGKVPQTLGQSEDHENLFPTELKVNLVRPAS